MLGLSSSMIGSLQQQHPPSTNGNKSSEDGVGLPVWWGRRRWSRARSSLTLWNAFVSVQLQMMPRTFSWGTLQQPACLEHWPFPAVAAGAIISWGVGFSGPWRHPWWLIGLQDCQCYLTESCNVWKRRCWTWQRARSGLSLSFFRIVSNFNNWKTDTLSACWVSLVCPYSAALGRGLQDL